MTREAPGQEPEPDDREPEVRTGALRPTSLLTLLGWAVVGLLLGWAVHPVSVRLGVVPPLVASAQPLALLLLAAILGYVAVVTRRTVRVRRQLLPAHQAVNRLVLARASALVGSLVAGGYLGYGLSWVGDPSELADDRLVRSLLACGAGVVAVVAALLLERACRVRGDGDPAD